MLNPTDGKARGNARTQGVDIVYNLNSGAFCVVLYLYRAVMRSSISASWLGCWEGESAKEVAGLAVGLA